MSKKPSRSQAVAERIHTHLKRIEADPNLNPVDSKYRTRRYWNSGAYADGGWVSITYVSYQGASKLRIAEAERYADLLDQGYVGQHWHGEKWAAR